MPKPAFILKIVAKPGEIESKAQKIEDKAHCLPKVGYLAEVFLLK